MAQGKGGRVQGPKGPARRSFEAVEQGAGGLSRAASEQLLPGAELPLQDPPPTSPSSSLLLSCLPLPPKSQAVTSIPPRAEQVADLPLDRRPSIPPSRMTSLVPASSCAQLE